MAETLEVCAEERLADLEKAILQSKEAGGYQNSKPKIQKVPNFLRRNAEFAMYCTPKLISIGPIHHDLKLGEQYKLMWTAMHVEEYSKQTNQDTKQASQVLHKGITDNIELLKKLFTKDAIENYNDKDLAWILFVDGCSVLQFMEKIDIDYPKALKLKIDQLYHMWSDLLLLENQIPFKVLELLSKNMPRIEDLMLRFVSMGDTKYDNCQEFQRVKPTHLLDLERSVFISDDSLYDQEQKVPIDEQQEGDGCNEMHYVTTCERLEIWQTYKNIRDLKAAGIQVKAQENWCWSNISFTSKPCSGELKLPQYVFNHVTPYFFRNLMAYEACPDFQNNFGCSLYFAFMDSLIDDAEDVKQLRLAGVIQNFLGTDEEVANLFNALGNELVAKMFNFWSTDMMANSKKYIQVKHEIEKHYSNKYKTWMAEFYNTHFNTPWAMLAFLAAMIALVLTFAQTWFAIYPKK